MTDTQKDGGPAYPHTKVFENGTGRAQSGKSLRDYFAGQALVGLLAHASGESPDSAVPLSWDLADAMLAARATPQPDPVRDELVLRVEALLEDVCDHAELGTQSVVATYLVRDLAAALSKAKEGQS